MQHSWGHVLETAIESSDTEELISHYSDTEEFISHYSDTEEFISRKSDSDSDGMPLGSFENVLYPSREIYSLNGTDLPGFSSNQQEFRQVTSDKFSFEDHAITSRSSITITFPTCPATTLTESSPENVQHPLSRESPYHTHQPSITIDPLQQKNTTQPSITMEPPPEKKDTTQPSITIGPLIQKDTTQQSITIGPLIQKNTTQPSKTIGPFQQKSTTQKSITIEPPPEKKNTTQRSITREPLQKKYTPQPSITRVPLQQKNTPQPSITIEPPLEKNNTTQPSITIDPIEQKKTPQPPITIHTLEQKYPVVQVPLRNPHAEQTTDLASLTVGTLPIFSNDHSNTKKPILSNDHDVLLMKSLTGVPDSMTCRTSLHPAELPDQKTPVQQSPLVKPPSLHESKRMLPTQMKLNRAPGLSERLDDYKGHGNKACHTSLHDYKHVITPSLPTADIKSDQTSTCPTQCAQCTLTQTNTIKGLQMVLNTLETIAPSAKPERTMCKFILPCICVVVQCGSLFLLLHTQSSACYPTFF